MHKGLGDQLGSFCGSKGMEDLWDVDITFEQGPVTVVHPLGQNPNAAPFIPAPVPGQNTNAELKNVIAWRRPYMSPMVGDGWICPVWLLHDAGPDQTRSDEERAH